MRGAILLTLSAIVLSGCSGSPAQTERVRAIVECMCSTAAKGQVLEECPDLVRLVGAAKLAAMSADIQKGYTIEVRDGDAPYPLGDGRGTHHVLIRTGVTGLGLRFRYDNQLDKFHILGYWTLSRSE